MTEQDLNMVPSPELLDALPSGVLIYQEEGNIVSVNAKLTGMIGISQSELSGRNIEVLFSLPTRVFFHTHVIPIIRLKGNVEEVFISLKGKEGQSVPVLFSANKMVIKGTTLIFCVINEVWQRKKYEESILQAKKKAEQLIEDNLDLKRVREELELKAVELDRQVVRLTQINQEYTALSKVVSHDFQEPIRKINLFTDLLELSEQQQQAPDKTIYQRIHASVERLRHLTDCLERFVSVDLMKDNLQTLSLHDIIIGAKDIAIAQTGFGEFDFKVADLPEIEGYRALLTEMFTELFKNAINYRDPGRRLQLQVSGVIARYNQFRSTDRMYKYVDYVKLDFSDNGVGFDSQYDQYIFQLFKRLEVSIPGMGFGLPLSRKIVMKHNGTIEASSNIGIGSTFQIKLPVLSSETKTV